MPVPGDILVVDDTMTALMMLVALLSTQGYQVSSAQSGAEALDLVQKHPPDLILLDFSMPDMDGLAVCRELKQSPRTRDIPVLFLSSVSDSQTKVDGFDAGAVDFIIKPFERSELLARVNTHLDLARLKKRLSKLVEEKTESLRLSEQRFRALIEQAPEAILVYNLDSGRFVDANRQAEKLTGRTLQALVGTSPTSLYAAEQPDGLPVAESVTLHAERAQKGEIAPFERILQRPDGSTIPCEVRLSKLPSETDHLLRVSYIDISSRVAAQEKINRLAYFDTLTGLHNESGLLEQLNALFAIAGGRHPFATPSPRCWWTWATSSSSTTCTATASATCCCAMSRSGCGKRWELGDTPPGWGAWSSRPFSPAWRTPLRRKPSPDRFWMRSANRSQWTK